jgi:hypothetical protein
MKDLIKQILREETSGLGPKMLNAAYKMMNKLTKDCLWYYDTPEQRFEYSPESIWLINPETKEWLLELEKSRKLWYYNEIYLTFKRYFNMEKSDFESFIKLWVKDVLKRGVSTTHKAISSLDSPVEDVLKRGVSTTCTVQSNLRTRVEDALKKGKELR